LITDHRTKHCRWWNVFDDIYRIRRWLFWSWFDVNRYTSDEDMRDKRFLHFPFSFQVTLTFRAQICSPVWRYVFTKLEVSTAFLLRENRRHGQQGRRDRRGATQRHQLPTI